MSAMAFAKLFESNDDRAVMQARVLVALAHGGVGAQAVVLAAGLVASAAAVVDPGVNGGLVEVGGVRIGERLSKGALAVAQGHPVLRPRRPGHR